VEAEPIVLLRPTVVSDWTVFNAFAMDQNHTLIYCTLLFLLHQLEEFHGLFRVLNSSLDRSVERVYGALARLAGQVP
jgi:hypothetical protein